MIGASAILLLAAGAAALPQGQEGQRRQEQTAELRRGAPLLRTAVPERPFDLILGRPTASSIAVSVLSHADREGHVEYGLDGGETVLRTPTVALPAGTPVVVELRGLRADRAYRYRLRHRTPGSPDFTASDLYGFHTARPPGSSFVFTVQADAHLDENTATDLYELTLSNALADAPDFHVDLGDTFMVDKHRRDYRDAAAMYLAQRYYFGLLCHSAPLFFALGNHDGETGFWLDGDADNMAVWSASMRKRYLPNPEPDGFYSGNAEKAPHTGLLQDYYAWTWGDALCVVLDPFWYSRDRRGKDGWRWTLGSAQHRWLLATLANSQARLKFVFVHQLVGGFDSIGRGGVTAAPYFEWGGRDLDESNAYAARRPGAPPPIHDLLVRHGVTAVFHGHDHMYAREQRDGIVYQLLPQPGHPGDSTRSAAEYGYPGSVLAGAGHLRLRVEREKATVEFVRAWLPAREGGSRHNGEVADRYQLLPRQAENHRQEDR